MHCTKIRFDGFKRLSTATCNTDTYLLAFVGPNEAGKSSLLDGLVWLTDGNEHELSSRDRTRGRDLKADHVVVEGVFELNDDDKKALADLAVVEIPDRLLIQRRRNGTLGSDAQPVPRRDPKPFVEALRLLDRAEKSLAKAIQAAEDVEEPEDDDEPAPPRPRQWMGMVRSQLEKREATSWESAAETDALIAWLDEIPSSSRTGKQRDSALARAVENARTIVDSEHPRNVARERLLQLLPRFIKFGDEHRELRHDYELSDEDNRYDPPPALANLLQIAGLNLEKLWDLLEDGLEGSAESEIDFANDRLREFFQQAWNQSRVTVRLKLNSRRLEVWLKELDGDGTVTHIDERSEGLLMFVSVATFVAAQHLEVAPILLIDEAETHLHFDAQADLVGVLLKQVQATQVFYTTHSPGCLPTDLGTGIRLVQRTTKNREISTIRSDFWTNEAPGFAPLLYAMGASAAAFSACRLAVLAEGAADMVLLPTLIRKATGLKDLPYQIAPGLANAHAYGMNVEEVAAKVVYLTDGDSEGANYRQQLEEAQVPRQRVFSLPKDKATEDLVSRQTFMEIVNTLLPEGVAVTAADLPTGQPVVKGLDDWLKRRGLKLGHVAIAYGLINNPKKVDLAPGAVQTLVKLHEKFMAAFEAGA